MRHGGSFWKNAQHVAALQLTPDDHLAFRVHAVDLKHRLCDIETDCRNRSMVCSSESWEP
jgi:hypothetical protein